MEESSIEDLAYLMKEAKKENLPQPIVFLGAGVSKSGQIPLASEIIDDILSKYKNNPKIKKLNKDDKHSYSYLMNCLTPFERNKLLKDYIDNAKINVTHTYLAQLIKKDFIDYVLTVNFDNLMLRALALYNEFPPVYDIAILNDLTTTTFKEKSIIYLHGQHHGLWLLNTEEELKKVENVIPPIFNSIKDRPWIFIGYSGEDPIFEHLIKLGRFDKGLYWITYNNSEPSEKVCTMLLEKELTNSFLIKGYDSDSFMLKLNTELELAQPTIIDKPFSSLKEILNNIVDIDDKEHFKSVKQRLEIVKSEVDIAINQFEKGNIESNKNLKKDTDINLLRKQIIDYLIIDKFDEILIQSFIAKSRKFNNNELNELISILYHSWGIALYNLAKQNNDESLYKESFIKYEKATNLNPKDDSAFNNWGTALSDLAQLNNDESLYKESFTKYEKATNLNPKDDFAFNNWGNALSDLAQLNNDESLYKESFIKYNNATNLNPKDESAFYNWGTALYNLAKQNNDESLYKESFIKYEKATNLNPKYDSAFNNWGTALSNLAKQNNDESLYKESFTKYEKATILNPKDDSAFYNWGSSLTFFAKLTGNTKLYKNVLEKYEKAFNINKEEYNLSCIHSLMENKDKALEYLENSLKNNEIKSSFVLEDEDWENYKDDSDFLELIKKY